jgi:predicted ArsR family transcriptional regulator
MSQSKKAVTKRGRKPTMRHAVIMKLAAVKVATAKELEVSGNYLASLARGGYVQIAGKIESGRRGRPAYAYKLTNRGRAIALNLRKAAAA